MSEIDRTTQPALTRESPAKKHCGGQIDDSLSSLFHRENKISSWLYVRLPRVMIVHVNILADAPPNRPLADIHPTH
jgi:hypothetical protein